MTIFKLNSNFIYFSHIPKCAGTSVESYFSSFENCSTIFLDRESGSILKNWAISSPQHIPGFAVEKLFSDDFFIEYFALIRNPIDRFKSAFIFNKYKNLIDGEINCNYFIQKLLVNNYLRQGWLDNHFQPQITFLIPNRKYKLFVMDNNGIKNLKKYIDKDILKTNINSNFPFKNKKKASNNEQDLIIETDNIAILKEIYKEDFDLYEEIKKNEHLTNKKYFITETLRLNPEVIDSSPYNIEKLILDNEKLRISNKKLKKILLKIEKPLLWKFLDLIKSVKNLLKKIYKRYIITSHY